jgi:hypothetical protein
LLAPFGRLVFLRQSFLQFVHVTPQRLPGGAFVVAQAVERLPVADGGEVRIAPPVGQPLLDGLFHGEVVLFG